MPFKFEKLEVWQLALDYIDLIYEIGNQNPRRQAPHYAQNHRAWTILAPRRRNSIRDRGERITNNWW